MGVLQLCQHSLHANEHRGSTVGCRAQGKGWCSNHSADIHCGQSSASTACGHKQTPRQHSTARRARGFVPNTLQTDVPLWTQPCGGHAYLQLCCCGLQLLVCGEQCRYAPLHVGLVGWAREDGTRETVSLRLLSHAHSCWTVSKHTHCHVHQALVRLTGQLIHHQGRIVAQLAASRPGGRLRGVLLFGKEVGHFLCCSWCVWWAAGQ